MAIYKKNNKNIFGIDGKWILQLFKIEPVYAIFLSYNSIEQE